MTQPTSYEFAVQQLVELGFPRAHAEAQVRTQLPHLTPPALVPARDDRVLEKAEQVEVRKTLIAFGFKIYNLSQARASRQSPGLPDLWFVHTRLPIAGWWETKRQSGGKLSQAQDDFRAECARAGVLHRVGDRFHARTFVVELGLAERVGDHLEPTQSRAAG